MQKEIAIGIQNFEKLIKNNFFYIDKSNFIKEWWESCDDVILITCPRRFGKTLNMSMPLGYRAGAFLSWCSTGTSDSS